MSDFVTLASPRCALPTTRIDAGPLPRRVATAHYGESIIAVSFPDDAASGSARIVRKHETELRTEGRITPPSSIGEVSRGEFALYQRQRRRGPQLTPILSMRHR